MGNATSTAGSGTSRRLMLALRIGLLALACWALRRELVGVDPRALVTQLRSYGWPHVVAGIAFTALSFLTLGIIEIVALRRAAAESPVPQRAGMTTAFIANAFSQSIGLALLTGAAVRLRAYVRYGMNAIGVGRVSAFVTLTVTLGLLATGAIAFLGSSAPLSIGGVLIPVRLVGAALALTTLAYLAWSMAGTRAVVGRGAWRIGRPSPALAATQLSLASADWLVTGTILFVLLPTSLGLGWLAVLRVYLVAQTVGSLSHVPGGAGVFELLVLSLFAPLTGPAGRAAIVASLVMFRALYYLVPLIGAIGVAALVELHRAHRGRGRIGDAAMVSGQGG